MNSNPLQYQQADENEPLYRAAMLSALAVGIIIALVLGINFVVRHSKSAPVPTAQRDYETSPDDTVNGMRHAMDDGSESGATAGAGPSMGSGPLPSQNFASTSGQQGGAGSMGPSRSGDPYLVAGGRLTPGGSGYFASEPPSATHTSGVAFRDWASFSPANIADILAGR